MKKIFSYQTWIIFSLIFLSILALVSINNPFHGDEKHIVETIRLFANNFSIETIKDYPEVTPPLFYIFYAIWAKLFSDTLISMRLLSLIISFATWQLLYLLMLSGTKNEKHSFLLSLLIIINPYFFGTSVYVFTDMLTLFFVIGSVLAFQNNKNILFLFLSSAAILCRQYTIIVPIAIIIYSLTNYKVEKIKSAKYILASIISFLPLIVLFVFWKGIAPKSGIEKWIIPNSSSYNLDYINTYLTFSPVYLFPLILFYFWKLKLNLTDLLISIGFTLILSFFPIKPSAATIVQTTNITVGYAHKLLILILGTNSVIEKLVLGIFLVIGSYMSIELIKMLIRILKESTRDHKIIFTFLWILFLVIMPFSYQVWEKYLLMILPFLALSIYQLIFLQSEIIKMKL
jgi:4-amino-4-deoxy-L-arabinose transferase-like glycosyltransferase